VDKTSSATRSVPADKNRVLVPEGYKRNEKSIIFYVFPTELFSAHDLRISDTRQMWVAYQRRNNAFRCSCFRLCAHFPVPIIPNSERSSQLLSRFGRSTIETDIILL
jgi:hypothetical protein